MTATAWFLAGLGAVPFVYGTGQRSFRRLSPLRIWAVKRPFQGYGAVILSFMGGVRWGRALRWRQPARAAEQMILSVAPSLACWLALLIDRPWSLLLLQPGFALQAALGFGQKFPQWRCCHPGSEVAPHHQRHR
jgi:hypothetical protein